MTATRERGRAHALIGRLDFAEAPNAGRPGSGVVGAGVWTLVAVASNGVARLLTVVMVGRAGGVDVLGSFQTGLSVAQLLVLLLPTALGSAASKFVAQGRANPAVGDPNEVYRFLRKRLRLAIVVLGVGALAVWLAVEGRDTWGAVEVVVLTCVLSWYSLNRGLLFGLGLARRSAFWDITTSVCAVVLIAALVILADPQHGALLVVALTYALFAVVNTPRADPGSLSAARRSEVDRFCVAVVFGTLASTGFLQLTMIMSRVVGGTEAAGQFAAALNLATPVSLLGASLSLVIFPELSGAMSRGDRRRVNTLVDRAFRLLLVLTVPVLVVTQFAAEPVVRAVLGRDFSDASSVLVILMASVMLTTVGIPCVTALTSGGQRGVRASALLSCAGLAVGVTSWTLLVPALDVDGVAWGYLVGSLVTASGPIVWAWRTQQQRWALPVFSNGGAILALAAVHSDVLMAEEAGQATAVGLICLGWAALQVPSIRTMRR